MRAVTNVHPYGYTDLSTITGVTVVIGFALGLTSHDSHAVTINNVQLAA